MSYHFCPRTCRISVLNNYIFIMRPRHRKMRSCFAIIKSIVHVVDTIIEIVVYRCRSFLHALSCFRNVDVINLL